MKIRYCSCSRCNRGDKIVNPYAPFEGDFSLNELKLEFDPRVHMFCRFGCGKFNSKPHCPPSIPHSSYYREALKEYHRAHVYARRYPYADGLFSEHWRGYSTNEIHHALLEHEMALFVKGHIYAKAFIGGSCKICMADACNANRCNIPHRGRAALEATGLNVLSLLKNIGQEYQDPPIDYFWRIGAVFY